MNTRRYVVNGSIVQQTPNPLAYISWSRLIFLSSILFALVASNPANKELHQQVLKILAPQQYNNLKEQQKLQQQRRVSMLFPKETNFGIFSIQQYFDGIEIHGLFQKWNCQYRNSEFGPLCESIALQMSHQKPLLWDKTDRPFTTHRILCVTLICLAMLSFCCPGAQDDLSTLFFAHYEILNQFLLSPFVNSTRLLFWNVASTCSCVYPTLVEMNRLISRIQRRNNNSIFPFTGNPNIDFIVAVILLVCVIGGGANWLSSRLCTSQSASSQKVQLYGYAPVLAACLGYYQQAVTQIPLFQFGEDRSISAVSAFWTTLILLPFLSNGQDSIPRAVAWILAGCGGTLLGRFHVDNQAWWGQILQDFGFF